MCSLGFDEARKQRANRESIDVAGMNAGEQRLGEIGHRLLTETAPDERADRFVRLVALRGDEQLRAHPKLAGP